MALYTWVCTAQFGCVCLFSTPSSLKPLPSTQPCTAEKEKYIEETEKRKRCFCGPMVSLTCFHSGDNGDKTQSNVLQIDEKCKNEYFNAVLCIRALDSLMAWHEIMLESTDKGCCTILKLFINRAYKSGMHFELNGG